MRNYRVRGIIIRRFDLHEADRIIVILTEERGLISARAKSVRKIKAKLKGALELFVYSKLELAEGRSIDVLTGAEAVEPFENFRKSLTDTSVAYYLSEAILGFLAEGEVNKEAFKLLLETLRELNQPNLRDRKRDILLSHFLLKLLTLSGYRPELFFCLKCGEKIRRGKNYFSFSLGGIVCQECQSGSSSQIEISDQAIKILRLLYQDGVAVSRRIKSSQQYLKEVKELLHQFLEYTLEKEVKSNHFLKEIEKID